VKKPFELRLTATTLQSEICALMIMARSISSAFFSTIPPMLVYKHRHKIGETWHSVPSALTRLRSPRPELTTVPPLKLYLLPLELAAAPLPPELAAASRAYCRFPSSMPPPELAVAFRACCRLQSLLSPPKLAVASKACCRLPSLLSRPELAAASRVCCRLQSLLPPPEIAAAARSLASRPTTLRPACEA